MSRYVGALVRRGVAPARARRMCSSSSSLAVETQAPEAPAGTASTLTEPGSGESAGVRSELMRFIPIVPRDRKLSQLRGGPFRLIRDGLDEVDLDSGYKDLSRIMHLHNALNEHVEFLRVEGDPKLDELRYAKIQLALGRAKKLVAGACRKLDIDVSRLTMAVHEAMDVPRSALDWEKTMEMYDVQDELRELMFQMDKLEPEESCISVAHKYLDIIRPEPPPDRIRMPEDVRAEELSEDELAANEREFLEARSDETLIKGFHTAIVEMRRTAYVTASGRVQTYRVLVAVGNLKGTGGVGIATARTVLNATKRATRSALRSLVYLDLHDGRTIHYPIEARAPVFKIWPAARGSGLRIYRGFRIILSLMGVKDIGGKMKTRSPSPPTALFKLMDLLREMKTSTEIMEARGKTYVDLSNYYDKVLQDVDQLRASKRLEEAKRTMGT